MVYFFLADDFFLGTLAPARRASDKPIAIACFRLLTFFPDRPLFKVPFFRSRIARSTFFDAVLPYLAMMVPSFESSVTNQAPKPSEEPNHPIAPGDKPVAGSFEPAFLEINPFDAAKHV